MPSALRQQHRSLDRPVAKKPKATLKTKKRSYVPRNPVSKAQAAVYEEVFLSGVHVPDPAHREKLSVQTGVDPRKIQIWFQNRRAKQRRLDGMATREKEEFDSEASEEMELEAEAPARGNRRNRGGLLDDLADAATAFSASSSLYNSPVSSPSFDPSSA